MTDRKIMQQALDAYDKREPLAVVMEELRERLAQPDAYGYASRLAVAIWEQHYKDVAPQWKPLDDLMGVLTQIDNMTVGLTRLAQPEQEPAYRCRPYSSVPGSKVSPPVDYYTAPPQRKPLTDEGIRRIELAVQGYTRQPFDVTAFARAIEAAHGIKENT